MWSFERLLKSGHLHLHRGFGGFVETAEDLRHRNVERSFVTQGDFERWHRIEGLMPGDLAVVWITKNQPKLALAQSCLFTVGPNVVREFFRHWWLAKDDGCSTFRKKPIS